MENKIMYQIPNNVVWFYNFDNKSIYQIINNDKLILLFIGLAFTTNYNGYSNFNIKGLLYSCNLPDTRDNVKLFKDMLVELYNLQLLTLIDDVDIGYVNKNTWLSILPKWFKIKDGKRSEFFTLYQDEINKIMDYDLQSINNYKLLTYYSYICSRMYNRKFYTNTEGKRIKVTLDMDRPETCFYSFREVNQDLGIDDNTITRYNDILVDIGLIGIKNPGYKKKIEYGQEEVRLSNNTYVLCRTDNWQDELDESVEGYISIEKKKGWIFITNAEAEKSIKNKQVLSNTINRLEFLQKTKGITPEQEQQLQDCIDKRDSVDKKQNEPEDKPKQFGKVRDKIVDFETGEIIDEPRRVIVGKGLKSFDYTENVIDPADKVLSVFGSGTNYKPKKKWQFDNDFDFKTME